MAHFLKSYFEIILLGWTYGVHRWMLHTLRSQGFDCLIILICIKMEHPPSPPSVHHCLYHIHYTVWCTQEPGWHDSKSGFPLAFYDYFTRSDCSLHCWKKFENLKRNGRFVSTALSMTKTYQSPPLTVIITPQSWALGCWNSLIFYSAGKLLSLFSYISAQC